MEARGRRSGFVLGRSIRKDANGFDDVEDFFQSNSGEGGNKSFMSDSSPASVQSDDRSPLAKHRISTSPGTEKFNKTKSKARLEMEKMAAAARAAMNEDNDDEEEQDDDDDDDNNDDDDNHEGNAVKTPQIQRKKNKTKSGSGNPVGIVSNVSDDAVVSGDMSGIVPKKNASRVNFSSSSNNNPAAARTKKQRSYDSRARFDEPDFDEDNGDDENYGPEKTGANDYDDDDTADPTYGKKKPVSSFKAVKSEFMASRKTKKSIVFPGTKRTTAKPVAKDEDDEDDAEYETNENPTPGMRRSTRRKWRPLHGWANERLVLERDVIAENAVADVVVKVVSKPSLLLSDQAPSLMRATKHSSSSSSSYSDKSKRKPPTSKRQHQQQREYHDDDEDDEQDGYSDENSEDRIKQHRLRLKEKYHASSSSSSSSNVGRKPTTRRPLVPRNFDDNDESFAIRYMDPITKEKVVTQLVKWKDTNSDNQDYYKSIPSESIDGHDGDVKILAGVYFETPDFLAGSVILDPLSRKPNERVNRYVQVFMIHQAQTGSIGVDINGHTFLLGPDESFFVPPGSYYSISNFSQDIHAKISFVVIKRRDGDGDEEMEVKNNNDNDNSMATDS